MNVNPKPRGSCHDDFTEILSSRLPPTLCRGLLSQPPTQSRIHRPTAYVNILTMDPLSHFPSPLLRPRTIRVPQLRHRQIIDPNSCQLCLLKHRNVLPSLVLRADQLAVCLDDVECRVVFDPMRVLNGGNGDPGTPEVEWEIWVGVQSIRLDFSTSTQYPSAL